VNSNYDVVLDQRHPELSSPEVKGGAIIFRVKQCLHYKGIFGKASRYLVSMVDTCRPRTLRHR